MTSASLLVLSTLSACAAAAAFFVWAKLRSTRVPVPVARPGAGRAVGTGSRPAADLPAVGPGAGCSELRAELRQSQKLAAVGRLASGVAHDFNNLLAVVQSGTTLVQECLPADHPAQASLADVSAAADRGVELTRQLLTFARKEAATERPGAVAAVLAEMSRFLPRVLGPGVRLRVNVGDALGEVPLPASSLQQVLLNLILNARDAMPRGGWIQIDARRVEVREGDASGLRPGSHVEISVRDHGTGMNEETRRRLFEPFFTTKDPGRGTGLGLATSLGIVEGAGGAIEVETEEGKGSVFRVVLPHVPLEIAVARRAGRRPPAGGRSRVLLVDQDPALVALLSRLLSARGHEVIAAATPLEARQQAASFPGGVDVVMAALELGAEHGVAALGEVRRTNPRARALLLASDVQDASHCLDHMFDFGVELIRRPAPAERIVEVVERAAARTPVRRDPALA